MNNNNQQGFSLIELILVVTIIGIIAAIAIPSLARASAAAENGSAISTLRTMALAQTTVMSQKNRFGRFDELNSVQNGNLGVVDSSNVLLKGKFRYEMIPANPTEEELKTSFKIKATRVIDASLAPYVIELDERGFITDIFQ